MLCCVEMSVSKTDPRSSHSSVSVNGVLHPRFQHRVPKFLSQSFCPQTTHPVLLGLLKVGCKHTQSEHSFEDTIHYTQTHKPTPAGFLRKPFGCRPYQKPTPQHKCSQAWQQSLLLKECLQAQCEHTSLG